MKEKGVEGKGLKHAAELLWAEMEMEAEALEACSEQEGIYAPLDEQRKAEMFREIMRKLRDGIPSEISKIRE